MKRLAVIILIAFLTLSGCTQKKADKKESAPLKTKTGNPVALIQTTMGDITLELFPDAAPKHAANFEKLIGQGFYDSTTFHRVIPGFMIQGGDPLSKDGNRGNDGNGNPGYVIDPEPNANKHERGAVGMARGNQPESNGSQFYICVQPQPHLDQLEFTIF
ncbi:peptidylprolyl isomerase, partial [bacterium]|nr:peptidylprolyl isomerase [bacterium]